MKTKYELPVALLTVELLDGRVLRGQTLAGVARAMRAVAWFPMRNMAAYRRSVARRCAKLGLRVRDDTSTHFMQDYIACGLASVLGAGGLEN